MESSVGVDVKLIAGCSKRPDFSPAQPRRLFHPPALSLPRQTLCPGTRLFPSKAATSDQNMILSSLLVISLGWGLIVIPLRASNEGLLRPRVARAKKIISLHPSPFLFFRLSQHRLEDGICVQYCFQGFCPDEEIPDVRCLAWNFSKPSFGFRHSFQERPIVPVRGEQ